MTKDILESLLRDRALIIRNLDNDKKLIANLENDFQIIIENSDFCNPHGEYAGKHNDYRYILSPGEYAIDCDNCIFILSPINTSNIFHLTEIRRRGRKQNEYKANRY